MKQKSIPQTGGLSDKQKETLYLEAKKLAERDSVGSYERAVFLLAKIPGWRDSDKISAAYRQRILVLQARSREKQRHFFKTFFLPAAGLALFAFLMVEFVYPELRVSNSLSREGSDIGTEFGAFEGIGGLTADENAGESVSENGDKNGGKAAVPFGEFDVSGYDPNGLSGEKNVENPLEEREEPVSTPEHREENFSVSGGV